MALVWKYYGKTVEIGFHNFFPFPWCGTQAECGISVVIVWNQNVELVWKLCGISVIIIKHIERILCGTSVEFLHSTLWNIRSIVWNMEFHNVELVWNYEFHINENASEIKQYTGIHDYSSTMCLNWVLWGRMVLPLWYLHCICCGENWLLEINSLKLLSYLILTLRMICVELVLTNQLQRVNFAHIYAKILRPRIVGKFEQTYLKE